MTVTTINAINNKILSNSFTNSVSSSGNSITETIQHTSDTAGSTASQIISVAGTSAANPYLAISPDGSNNFAIGAINSANPAFSISYGASATPGSGTQAINVTQTGYLTKPNQPAFYCYLGSALTNVTGDTTSYQLVSWTKPVDQSSNFNATTGVFTAPVAGFYIFGLNVYAKGWASSNYIAYLSIVGTSTTLISSYYRWYNIQTGGGANNSCGNMEGGFSMSVGDTAYFVMYASGSSKNISIEPNTFCWGFLKS
jgi:hypothetical protein